ncbi:MAG: hypothetical protein HOP08_15210 [Cyclobacteriaceae bacterium]|nr:hypothetical protein [Cyclobacteriaceae bacterium]
MQQQTLVLLFFYGVFLILCGITSVIFIGMKAKTALISGGISGLASIGIGHMISTNSPPFELAGVLLPLLLFIVFSWRSTKTLFKIFELIPSNHEDLKGKGVAFLIISLMAVVSLVVFILQIIN